jgi:SAM-dependent methyltransferase
LREARKDLDEWACPVCLSHLSEDAAGLRCTAEDRVFPRRDGLPVLLRPEDEALLSDAEAYAGAWKRDELAPPKGSLHELPYVPSPYWRPKARSLEALLKILGPAAGRKVADAGAGTGWLSYRLAEAGFLSYATDISADADVGLGASRAFDATPYRFERGIASLTRWPFLSGSMDVAIANASLHYLPDIRPAVAEAARVLRTDGLFIVMNDPVHRDRRSAERAATDFRQRMRESGGRGRLVDGHRHFVTSEVEEDLRTCFPSVTRHDPDYGARFRVTRAVKEVLLRMELASFPIYVAQSTADRAPRGR